MLAIKSFWKLHSHTLSPMQRLCSWQDFIWNIFQLSTDHQAHSQSQQNIIFYIVHWCLCGSSWLFVFLQFLYNIQ
jgi:hypothetical protein